MPAANTLEITIPVLNEAGTLRRQVSRAVAFIRATPALSGRTTLCLADNGSTDETAPIARELERQLPLVRFVQVDRVGVGLALRASWQSTAASFVGYMDLDLSTDLGRLPQCLALLEEERADVVTGSRLLPASTVRGRRLTRGITSRTFNGLLRFYLGTDIRDSTCGFKFLRREVLDLIVAGGAQSDGWFFCPELLLVAEAMGLTVQEVAVDWTDDPDSKVNIRRLSLEYLRGLPAFKRTCRNLSATARGHN